MAKAVEWLNGAHAEASDPGALLDWPFTMNKLRELHGVVEDQVLMRDTFRRFMEPKLQATGQMSDGTRAEAVAVVGAGRDVKRDCGL